APALCRAARLRAGKTVHAQEPPVVLVGGRDSVEQIPEQLVAIPPAAGADEAVDPGDERQHEGIARRVGEMLAHEGKAARQIAVDGKGERLDFAALYRATCGPTAA